MNEKLVTPFYIGDVKVNNRLVLAPMAGYTDCAMRTLCARSGAGLTVTEMVSAKGLLYCGQKSAELLYTSPAETVKCAQIFGHEPNDFYKVLTETEYLNGFDIIDVNMGCPVPKIVKNGEGSSLIKDVIRAKEIVSACVDGAKGRPITVKTRMGFDEGEDCSISFCKEIESAGVSAITLHARTKAQGYAGKADWSVIEKVKKELNVPLIGSGDVNEQNAENLIEKCDALMIGRSAVGNPYIFACILEKEYNDDLTSVILEHIELMNEYYGERYTYVNMRKFIGGYYGGMRGNKEIKQKCFSAQSVSKLKEIVQQIKNFL